MNIKHIYWFSYFNCEEPSVRYRAHFPLKHLKNEYQIPYTIFYPQHTVGSFFRFLKLFITVLLFRKKDSVIVFQKIYTGGLYAQLLKLLLLCRHNNTLYDIDDAEYTRHPVDTMHYFMKHCRSCSVGSRALAHYIHPFNTNTLLLTSPVTEQAATQAARSGIFTIGWIGYYSAHRKSLHQLFFPGIKKIDFPVQLLMLGVRGAAETAEIKALFQDNPNIIINTPQTIDWQNEDSIYTYIRQFDVGISPLLDNEFNRCKSAFKLKQCMVCGVPVLGSSIGENNVFIRHGANGFFCDSPDEYLEKITLIKNISGQHYSSMRQSALATYPSFSIDHYCTAFILHYKSSHQQGVRQYANYEGMKIPAPMS